MDEVLSKLRSINYTLNLLEVRGRTNLDQLLGCMVAVDEAIHMLEKQQEGQAEENSK